MPAFLRRLIHQLLSGPAWFWNAVSSIPVLRFWINRMFINTVTNSTPARPHPLSLWSAGPPNSPPANYPSWNGLTDRRFTGRHLPPADLGWLAQLPAVDDVVRLFPRSRFVPCPRSTALFSFFAQWFTDSFLRTDPEDLRKTTSNHEIDLCQIYGLHASDTDALRAKVGGRLKCQTVGGEVFPPSLFTPGGLTVKEEFLGLSYIDAQKRDFRYPVLVPPFDTPERKRQLFASGLERGNSTIYYSALNTVFLREHNRLCGAISLERPGWDDDQLFEAARCTNIALLLKVIVEDYINHLSSTAFKVFVDVGFAEHQKWYRTNRIAAEFNLLYRWHSLVPSRCFIRGTELSDEQFRFSNDTLRAYGLSTVLAAASAQHAGRISLFNTAPFLVDAEKAAVSKARAWQLRSFNDYCERFSLPRVKSFEELTGDAALAAALAKVYQTIDDVELLVGLLAEDRDRRAVFGDLMAFMVGSDAFSQALTNPLLAKEVFTEETFSKVGLATIERTRTLNDIVQRNVDMAGRSVAFGMRR